MSLTRLNVILALSLASWSAARAENEIARVYGALSAPTAGPLLTQPPYAELSLSLARPMLDLPPEFLDPSPMSGDASGQHQLGLRGQMEFGEAVWYEHAGRTASGDIFDPNRMTGAHESLPFGTKVRVTNLRTSKSALVVINDRLSRNAAIDKDLVIDLSRAAAKEIGLAGRAPVTLRVEGQQALAEPIVATDSDQAQPACTARSGP